MDKGTYFNPQFCINGNDTVRETKLHLTQAIENDCLDWLSNRDTTKPFYAFFTNSSHHTGIGDLTHVSELFSDFDFPLPRRSTMTMRAELQQVKT